MLKFHVSSRKSEILHFDGLLLFKSYKVSAKNVQKGYFSWPWRVTQILKQNWLVVSKNNMRNLVNFHPTTGKSLQLGSFCPKYIRFEIKKYRAVITHNTEPWCKNWINNDLAASKIKWATVWTFIIPLKCQKLCTLIGCFCPKHIMFQLENFRGIRCHDTENRCKIWLAAWKMT